MRIPFVQIDAFADAAFAGNPAAVMPLTSWPEEQRAAFMEVAARQPGIRGIHDFRTRRRQP